MDLTGKIIAVLPAQSGVSQRTGNGWMSQDYVIEVPGQYPKKCVFKLFGEDRIRQLNIQQGQDGTVSFDIDAHEYNGRWFNEIRAYNWVPTQQQAQQGNLFPPTSPTNQNPAPAQGPVGSGFAAAPFPPTQAQSDDDDLPF